jgi:hypothetical protein
MLPKLEDLADNPIEVDRQTGTSIITGRCGLIRQVHSIKKNQSDYRTSIIGQHRHPGIDQRPSRIE